MKNSIKYPAIIAIAAAGVLFTYGAVNVFAQTPSGGTVFDRVVASLHLSVTPDQLKTAFQDSNTAISTEKISSELSAAVTAGKLTQAQADIAAKIPAALQSLASTETKPDFSTFKSLTPDEMKAKMTELETQRSADLAKALGISVDDLKTLQTALQSAGVREGFGPMNMGFGTGPGGRGHGGRMGGFATATPVDITKALADAVTSGKLTQAQSDLLAKVPDAMKTIMSSETKPDFNSQKSMTDAERQAEFDKMQSDIQTKLAAALAISVDDLKTLQTAAENAGIPVMGFGGGRRGIMHIETGTSGMIETHDGAVQMNDAGNTVIINTAETESF